MEKTQWWKPSGILWIALIAVALAIPAAAQQTQLPDAPSSSEPKAAVPVDQNSPHGTNPANDRILWTLPNYLTVENADHVAPLTVKEKFKITAKDCFDPVEFPFTAILAGIGQAQNSEPSYGQGLQRIRETFRPVVCR